MKKLKAIYIYEFTCPECQHSLTTSKPFPLYYCPYCGFDLHMDYSKKGETIYEIKRIDS